MPTTLHKPRAAFGSNDKFNYNNSFLYSFIKKMKREILENGVNHLLEKTKTLHGVYYSINQNGANNLQNLQNTIYLIRKKNWLFLFLIFAKLEKIRQIDERVRMQRDFHGFLYTVIFGINQSTN